MRDGFYVFLVLFMVAVGLVVYRSKPAAVLNARMPTAPDTSGFLADTSVRVPFRYFQDTVIFDFSRVSDSKASCEAEAVTAFESRQDSLGPAIFAAIVNFYKESYAAYRSGATLVPGLTEQEIRRSLPLPDDLPGIKRAIQPFYLSISRGSGCADGNFDLEFECTWDIENGLAVVVKDWKVVTAGTAEGVLEY